MLDAVLKGYEGLNKPRSNWVTEHSARNFVQVNQLLTSGEVQPKMAGPQQCGWLLDNSLKMYRKPVVYNNGLDMDSP